METLYLKRIEYIFYSETEIRDAVTEAREKRIAPLLRNGSGLSDPTASAALKNIAPVNEVRVFGRLLKNPETWLTVIDKTREYCRRQGELYVKLLRSRYTGEAFAKTCITLEISVDTYYRMLDKIRNCAALWAAWFHLICIE